MKSIWIAVLAIASFSSVNGQNSLLNFNEESLLINGASVDVSSTLLKGNLKAVQKSWDSFVKTHLKESMKEQDGVLVLKETVVNQITDKRGDLLAYIYNKDNDISFNVAYKLGYDVYMNSSLYPDEASRLKEFVNYFVYNYYNDYLPDHIKGFEKSWKVLDKEHNKAEKALNKAEAANQKLAKTTAKQLKKVTRLEEKISKATDDAKKADFAVSKNELLEKNKKLAEDTSYNVALIATQQSIMDSLQPKMDAITKDINSAKLTLIEVRSKLKAHNGY